MKRRYATPSTGIGTTLAAVKGLAGYRVALNGRPMRLSVVTVASLLSLLAPARTVSAHGTVQLVSADGSANGHILAAVTNRQGMFQLDNVPAGVYLAGFLHPSLDSLGIESSLLRVDLSSAEPVVIRLATPSTSTLIDARYGAPTPELPRGAGHPARGDAYPIGEAPQQRPRDRVGNRCGGYRQRGWPIPICQPPRRQLHRGSAGGLLLAPRARVTAAGYSPSTALVHLHHSAASCVTGNDGARNSSAGSFTRP